MKFARFLIPLLLLVLLSALASSTATAANSGESSSTQCRGEEVSRAASANGLRAEDMEHICELSLSIGELSARTAAAFPETFGGVWLDEARSGRVQVAFAGSVPTRQEVLHGFPEPQFVDLVQHHFSLTALQKVADAITADVEGLERQGILISGSAVDYEKNHVRVWVEGLKESGRQVLEDRFGREKLHVVEGARPRPAACLSRYACTPYMRGGLYITNYSHYCTSGFEVYRTNTSNYGQPALMTAGHCFPAGHYIYHADINIGRVVARNFVDGGCCDGEAISQNALWLSTNWVYFDDYSPDPLDPGGANSTEYPITAVKAKNTEYQDEPVCRTGVSTGPWCGKIIAKGDITIDNGDGTTTTLRQQLFSDICAIGGDSGGPFVFAGRAYGVVSAGNFNPDNNTCDPTSPFSTFTNAQILEEGLLVKIRTSWP